jgi:phage terminase large subunit-like protein
VIKLTTQSDEPPAGVFKADLDRFRGIRDGAIVAPKALGLLYEFPQSMLDAKSYLDPANFYITNPNIGRSVSSEWLADKLAENQSKDDGSLQTFLAKHLNIEMGLGLRTKNWAGAMFWEQQGSDRVTLDAILEDCEVVTAGIDGGGLDDLLALALVGRHKDTGSWLHWAHAWAHPIALERRKKEAPRLRDFERDGDLTVVEKVADDIEGVVAYLQRVEDAGLLERVGCDPAAIGGIHDALIGMGLDDDRIVGIPQGWKLVSAIKTLERKLAEGTFVHGKRRMMDWCVGNAKVEPRGNAIVITKQVSGFAKIDPLMATFNAVALMALNPAPARRHIHMFTVG